MYNINVNCSSCACTCAGLESESINIRMRDVYYNVYTYVSVCTVQSVLACMCVGTIYYYYTCLKNKKSVRCFLNVFIIFHNIIHVYTHTYFLILAEYVNLRDKTKLYNLCIELYRWHLTNTIHYRVCRNQIFSKQKKPNWKKIIKQISNKPCTHETFIFLAFLHILTVFWYL